MVPLIEIKGLAFGYDGRMVLDGAELEVWPGDRIGIIGPTGSGKTTLLYLIMGLLRPAQGVIRVFGKERVREEDFKEVRRRVGLLFQDPDDQLFCPTVIEDVAFGPLNLGKKGPEAKAQAREILARLGLSHLEARPVHTLSGGEKRLVSLASVLAMGPEVLLLDEPTTGLDEETKGRVFEIIRDACETFVVVSHDRETLRALADRLYLLRSGRLHPLPGDQSLWRTKMWG